MHRRRRHQRDLDAAAALDLVKRGVSSGSKTDHQEDVKRVGRKFVLFFTVGRFELQRQRALRLPRFPAIIEKGDGP
jgi:hypothetical protein